MIARKLGVSTGNVDIFTVLNHPTLEKTVDVRFAAHGSPYYRPARLDGIVNQFKIEVTFHIASSTVSSHLSIILKLTLLILDPQR